MILLDLNLLIYAYYRHTPHHEQARNWLFRRLSDHRPVGLAWLTLVGFLRLTTSKNVRPEPFTTLEATLIIDRLLHHPSVKLLQPSINFWSIYQNLLQNTTAHGNLANDAYLAALAIDHNATFATHDADFQRWHPLGLSLTYPLA